MSFVKEKSKVVVVNTRKSAPKMLLESSKIDAKALDDDDGFISKLHLETVLEESSDK